MQLAAAFCMAGGRDIPVALVLGDRYMLSVLGSEKALHSILAEADFLGQPWIARSRLAAERSHFSFQMEELCQCRSGVRSSLRSPWTSEAVFEERCWQTVMQRGLG